MKRTIRFALCGIDFSIPLLFVLGLVGCYGAGVISSLFISVEISDKLFSPLLILFYESGAAQVFLHSFLYFYLFPILALVFGTSYFGFLLFPPMVFLKGLFSALAVQWLLQDGSFSTAFLFYGVLLVLEVGLLILYFAQSMRTSFAFFHSRGDDGALPAFSHCLKQFAAAALCMAVPAVCCGLVQYLF